jgi:hypothetical protein
MQSLDPFEASSRLYEAGYSGQGLAALLSYGLGPLAFWLGYLTVGYVVALVAWRMAPTRYRRRWRGTVERLVHPLTLAFAVVWPALLVSSAVGLWCYVLIVNIQDSK